MNVEMLWIIWPSVAALIVLPLVIRRDSKNRGRW